MGILNDVEVHYQIRFHIPGVPTTSVAQDVATPGAVRPWVADFADRSVL